MAIILIRRRIHPRPFADSMLPRTFVHHACLCRGPPSAVVRDVGYMRLATSESMPTSRTPLAIHPDHNPMTFVSYLCCFDAEIFPYTLRRPEISLHSTHKLTPPETFGVGKKSHEDNIGWTTCVSNNGTRDRRRVQRTGSNKSHFAALKHNTVIPSALSLLIQASGLLR